MSLATEKDEVLTKLTEEREINLTDVDYIFEEGSQRRFYALFFKHRLELEQNGFIEYYENDGALVDVQRVRMEPKGAVFLVNGGYTAVEEKELREEKRKQVEWRWRRGYEAGTLIVALVAIGFTAATYFFTPSSNDVRNLQLQIDSLKRVRSLTVRPSIIRPRDSSRPDMVGKKPK